MSHVAQCKAVLKDEFAIREAVKRLGGTLRENYGVVRFYESGFVDDSQGWREFFEPEEAARIASLSSSERRAIINKLFKSATHVVSFPGAHYDLGLYRQPDGTYRLRWDTWANGGGLHKTIGSNAGLFVQAYGIEAAKRAARMRGYQTKETQRPDGRVELEMLVR